MTKVNVPYSFVPLSRWVYMPNWAPLVSHDHPFEDGLSGKIVFKINNTTPLCVGHEKDETGLLKFVRNSKDQLIIPQSTLKGLFRSVTEIATFGKFNQVNDRQFSYRDISNSNNYYLSNIIKNNDVISGWIKYSAEEERWEFTKCDYAKISHKDIKEATSVQLKNDQPAIEKYSLLPLTTELSATISAPKGKQKNRWAENIGSGGALGHTVYTNARILSGGNKPEFYEFSYFFYNRATSPQFTDIDKHVQNLFSNHNEEQVSYLKDHPHPEYGIPVFALVKRGQLHSFGLAKMPRVSYENSIKDMIRNTNPAHLSEAYFDLAELMFGTIKDHGLGLRSRIYFGDAVISSEFSNSAIYEAPATVLGEPKATFLGAYIEQNQAQQYHSYNHDDAKLSGWKRYPARHSYTNHLPANDNEKVQSRFELLEEGHEFQGQLIFHNLKRVELAALVWCMTLGNSPYQCHTVGHAKPLGAGTINLTIDDQESQLRANSGDSNISLKVSELVEEFEQHMNTVFPQPGKWLESPQIRHLLALTDEDIENYNDFRYMELEQFKRAKTAVDSMPPLDHNGQELARIDIVSESLGSPIFGKGRLSALLTDSAFDKGQLQLAEEYAQKQLKAAEKAKVAEEKSALESAEMSEFDKCRKRLELLSVNQEDMTRTDKNNRTAELRDCLKVVKTLKLESAQAQQLLDGFNTLQFGEQVVKKATKYLEKI
ncbi:TIGR03986 family CRISPR-associated RAMP protein [Vibrio mexicanus]|uniref:TIGR03986 family type III CRISPR-associated RAMP protein n=1 Tax=Vibrio mexicanus TaxID=1004326 RepID=UPI00063C0430|nr:TIGR03986 family CRISPR-associated RAMP protein [Vibrio mexicanus]